MTIYDDIQQAASDVLSDLKQGSVSLVKITAGNGPADNPGTPTTTNYSLDATIKGASFKYVRNGMAVETDLQVSAAVLDGITVSVNDFIAIDGVNHKILHDISAPAAGTRCVWKFLVRRGG